ATCTNTSKMETRSVNHRDDVPRYAQERDCMRHSARCDPHQERVTAWNSAPTSNNAAPFVDGATVGGLQALTATPRS
ncbi:hypothetical protein NDU88_002213, partial [Pleurodeles waltl]